MKKIYIIHGWGGSPQNDWLSYAVKTFSDKGYEVQAPQMPNTDNPVIEEWIVHLRSVVNKADENTYFIGHSIGCQTILRYLETIETKVGGVIFVAGWFNLENLESEDEEKIAEPWINNPLDFSKIKTVLPKSILLISDNDPYGALEYNKQKFTELGSKIIVLNNVGHITTDDGFDKFPQLIEVFEDNF